MHPHTWGCAMYIYCTTHMINKDLRISKNELQFLGQHKKNMWLLWLTFIFLMIHTTFKLVSWFFMKEIISFMCVPECMHMFPVCVVPVEAARGVLDPLTEDIWCACWDLNSGPLQEQHVLSSADPCPQPWFHSCVIEVYLCRWNRMSRASQLLKCLWGTSLAVLEAFPVDLLSAVLGGVCRKFLMWFLGPGLHH